MTKTDDIIVKLTELKGDTDALKNGLKESHSLVNKLVSGNQRLVLAIFGLGASNVVVKLVGSPPIIDAAAWISGFAAIVIPGLFLYRYVWVKKPV